MDAPEGPELVGSGGFKVDAARALEKLQRFQLADPADFLLCWARGAVASGAKKVEVTRGGARLEVAFDGEPLAMAWLESPLDVLLGGSGGAAEQYLAQGALGALRRGNARVTVASGRPPERWRAVLAPSLANTFERDVSGGARTVAALEGPGALFVGTAVARLEQAAGLAGCEVRIDGRALPALPGGPVAAPVAVAGLAGLAAVPRGAEAALHLYRHGVEAFRAPIAARVPISLHLRDDAVGLNLGLEGSVSEERLAELAAAWGRAVQALMPAAIALYEPVALREVRALLERRARGGRGVLGDVQRFFEDLRGKTPLDGPGGKAGDWLLSCARALLSLPANDAGDAALDALWRAKLFFTVGGEPLSLLDIRRLEEQGRLYGVFGGVAPADAPRGAVWCARRAELDCLHKRFPAAFQQAYDDAEGRR